MDRRNFVKYLGGGSLALMCGSAEALAAGNSVTGGTRKNYKGIRFNPDGQLKIVQFTDTHYCAADKAHSQRSLDCLNAVLDAERPDFAVITGDLVFSTGTYEGLDLVLEPLISRGIPFATVFGNHDDEFDHSRPELYDYIVQKKGARMPLRHTEKAPDYIVPILPSQRGPRTDDGEEVPAALLYCIDSNAYSPLSDVPGYDWIHHDQICWYRNESQRYTQMAGKPLPAFAFYHIPIPEYKDALMDVNNRVFGVKAEGICCPQTNSGLFTANKECGDILAHFCGHDHDNDYAVMYKNVLLAYGRYSGGDTVYNDIPNGARIIIMHEGTRNFETYIRLGSGEIESRISVPDSFQHWKAPTE